MALPGLEAVFRAVCRHAAVQRCQVHKARNVLVTGRRTDRRAVAVDLRRIFYAPDRATATGGAGSTRRGQLP